MDKRIHFKVEHYTMEDLMEFSSTFEATKHLRKRDTTVFYKIWTTNRMFAGDYLLKETSSEGSNLIKLSPDSEPCDVTIDGVMRFPSNWQLFVDDKNADAVRIALPEYGNQVGILSANRLIRARSDLVNYSFNIDLEALDK